MASRGVNKVILVGNLGADPEVRYTGSGAAVANLRIATTDRWRDKESGDFQERTEWHRVVMFSRLAEIAQEYLKKGRQVYIEGRLQTRKWQDQQGNDRYSTEVVANDMQMLGQRDDPTARNRGPAPNRKQRGPLPPTARRRLPRLRTRPRTSPRAQENAKVAEEEFDDDIPF